MKKKKRIITDYFYREILVEDLILKWGYKNLMVIPKIKKIVLNSTSKTFIKNRKNTLPTLFALESISGQKVVIKRAKKSIAQFKLREGQLIGCTVTLRGKSLNNFFSRYLRIILPRLPNFEGFRKKEFDSLSIYNKGINNLLLFPELENFFEFFEFSTGFNLSIENSNKNIEEIFTFFSGFQIPLKQ